MNEQENIDKKQGTATHLDDKDDKQETMLGARGCRHHLSAYEINPDDLSVWCFSCNPPRRVC